MLPGTGTTSDLKWKMAGIVSFAEEFGHVRSKAALHLSSPKSCKEGPASSQEQSRRHSRFGKPMLQLQCKQPAKQSALLYNTMLVCNVHRAYQLRVPHLVVIDAPQ